jgi:hypothetical protein
MKPTVVDEEFLNNREENYLNEDKLTNKQTTSMAFSLQANYTD